MTRSIYYLAKLITLNNSIIGRTVMTIHNISSFVPLKECVLENLACSLKCTPKRKPLAHRVHRLYVNYLWHVPYLYYFDDPYKNFRSIREYYPLSMNFLSILYNLLSSG